MRAHAPEQALGASFVRACTPASLGSTLPARRSVERSSRATVVCERAKHRLLPAPPAIAERFAIDRPIGAGSFGTVYRAFDRERSEAIALKHLVDVRPESIARFGDELRHARAVAHPNVAAAHELLRLDGEWLLSMELVHGVPLYRRLGVELDRKAAALDATVLAMLALAEALRAVHASGRIHRDVKPSNVLAEHGNGRIVLVDFGLAIELEAAARPTRRVAGTLHYMAPEQAAGEALGPASDWYAWGVMLYEALTGRRPIDGTPCSIAEAKLTVDPRPPSTIDPSVPREIDALCFAVLARRPEARPSGDAIVECLASSSEAARSRGAWVVRGAAIAPVDRVLSRREDRCRMQG